MHVTSPWLSQRSVCLSELPPSLSIDQDNLAQFFSADIPIIVANPLSESLNEALHRFRSLLHPNLVIVLNAAASPRASELARSSIAQSMGCPNEQAPRLVFANIDQALHALDALRDNAMSPSTINDYQISTTSSGISGLTDTIDAIIHPQTAQDSREQIARFLAGSAIGSLRDCLLPIHATISSARSRITSLSSQVNAEGDAFSKQLFGSSTTYASLRVGTSELRDGDYGTIVDMHKKAGAEVHRTLKSLKWWKLPAVADEVQYRVNNAVERAYHGDVERHVGLHSSLLILNLQWLTIGILANFSRWPPRLHTTALYRHDHFLITIPPSHLIDLLHPPQRPCATSLQPIIPYHTHPIPLFRTSPSLHPFHVHCPST